MTPQTVVVDSSQGSSFFFLLHGPSVCVRQVCEKYLANWKDVFLALTDLKKAHDTIDRHGMSQMLRVYGVGGKLQKAVQSFYIDSRACVRGRICEMM